VKSDRSLLAVLAAALLLWAWVCVPTLFGARTFYLRDVFISHLPFKAFGAEELRHGHIPAFNPTLNLGQAFRGNPNTLAFYPGNLAYLILPFWSAFNLHYALHWLLALATMAALARGLGQGRAASLFAGLTYAGSGWMLSALTFYNVLAVAAWWPLVLLGAVRGGRRGIALGGIACGLALLAGEPVTAAIGLVPLAVAAISRQGWRRGTVTALAIGAVGSLVALPQLVATMRAAHFTFRATYGMSPDQVTAYSLHPLRLIELLVPFPFGWPTYLGRQGVWAVSILHRAPLFLSLYAGLVALWLAAAAVRRHPEWALLAAGGPLLAILGGSRGALLRSLSFGLFRYPEKFLFWLALALPILAGWGVERAIAAESGTGFAAWRRLAAVAGALFLALAGALALAAPTVTAAVAAGLTSAAEQKAAAIELLHTQITVWILALSAGGGGLILAVLATRSSVAPAVRSHRGALLTALQLGLLAQLYPLAMTDAVAPYRTPGAWARRLGPGTAVFVETLAVPAWTTAPSYRGPAGPPAIFNHITAADLDAAPNVLYGLRYPLAPDLEGMQSPLVALMLYALPTLGWTERVRWFRSVGLQAVVLFEVPRVPGLRLLDQAERFGVTTRLYAVEDPAPPVWWPRRIVPVADPHNALAAVSRDPDPIAIVCGQPVPHDPDGQVRLISSQADRIEIEVESRGGGLAVVRRAYHPLLVARAGDKVLTTLPVNLNLLGVVVPAGRHRVVFAASAWPEAVAGGIAVLAFAIALTAIAVGPRRSPGHTPGSRAAPCA